MKELLCRLCLGNIIHKIGRKVVNGYILFNSWIKKIKSKRLIIPNTSILYPKTKIKTAHDTRIVIGKRCRIGSLPSRYAVGAWSKTRLICWKPGGIIQIGNDTVINGANICTINNITIGERCLIACGVNIMDYNAHISLSYNRLSGGGDIPKAIKIGDNVWIGLNAIILKGTEIGSNSIVAAGSVVKGIFPQFSLIAGNPAILVKLLDKAEFVE